MQIAVERRPGSKVALTVTVEPSVLQQRMEHAFQKHARRVTVPGFRPGKAPRKMLEERVNQHLLRQDAIEAVIDATYKEALVAENLEPLERGEIEDMDTNDEQQLTYTVVVSVRPEVTLADYTGLTITPQVTAVTDEQVTAEIDRLRERTADFMEVTDDGVATGDYVTIDYTMTLDGEAYPEGDMTGYPLEVGSDTFFPELNDGLVGVKQGENTTLSTSYPADYSNKDLAGKTAAFEITVQQIRRMVKADASDEWAQVISQGALQTIDELRDRLKQNLQAMASQSDRDHTRGELVRQVVEKAELDIPDTLVEEEFEHLMSELEHRLNQERATLDDYAAATRRSIDDIRNEQQLLARDMVRRSLVLQEVARREKLSVTDADLDAYLTAFAQGGQSVGALRKDLQKKGRLDSIVSRLFHEKVLSFLESQATIVTPAEGDVVAAPVEAEPKKKAAPRKPKAKKVADAESAE